MASSSSSLSLNHEFQVPLEPVRTDLSESDRNVKTVYDLFHFRISPAKAPAPPIGGVVLGINDNVTDWSTLLREAFGLSPVVASSPATASMGLSSALNIPGGAIGIVKYSTYGSYYEKVGYQNGLAESRLGIAKSTFQLTGGIGFTAARFLSIASTLTGSTIGASAPTLLGRAAFWTITASMILFVICFVFMIAVQSMQIRCRNQFVKEMKGNADPHDQLEFLQKRMFAFRGTDEIRTFYDKFQDHELIRNGQKFALENLKAFIKMNKDSYGEGLNNATDEELEMIIDDMLEAYSINVLGREMTDEIRASFYKEMAASAISYIVQERKDLELNAYFGKESVTKIKGILQDVQELDLRKHEFTEEDYNRRIGELTDEVNAIIASAKKSENTKAGVIIAIVLFGAIAMILGIVLTGPLAAFIIPAMFIAMGLSMLLLDAYYLWKEGENMQLGKYDELIAKISIVIGVAAIVAAFVSMSVFSFGTLPVIMTLAIGIPWILSQGYFLYKIDQHNEAQRLKALEEDEEDTSLPAEIPFQVNRNHVELIEAIYNRLVLDRYLAEQAANEVA